VRRWLALVALSVVVFTALYMLLDGWSLSDAFYMTAITLTTVGFREVRELDELGRIVTVAAALTGAALIFGGVGIMGEMIVAELTSGRRERRRMQGSVDALRGHVLVCGYGRVGSTVARALREAGRQIVVLDVRADSLERARADGYLVVDGDATEDAILDRAGIDRASGLVASIDSDANNVYVVLTARTKNPSLFIVARAAAQSAEPKLLHAGADRIVSPYTMAGRRIAELVTRPAVVDFMDAALSTAQVSFGIEQHRVVAGGPLAGRTIGALAADGVLTLAVVHDGRLEPYPAPEREVGPGDELVVSGPTERLRAVLGAR
jgi:voltage-gated potassium channel